MKKTVITIAVLAVLFIAAAMPYVLTKLREYTGQSGDTQFTLEVTGGKTMPKETFQTVCNIIENRLKNSAHVEKYNLELDADNGRLIVTMPLTGEQSSHVRSLLQSTGDVQFWETYDGYEVMPLVSSLMNAYADSLAGFTGIPTAEDLNAEMARIARLDIMPKLTLTETPGMIGFANSADTAAVNQMLQSPLAKTILPKALFPLWSIQPEQMGDDTPFCLYALKSTNGGPAIEGDNIVHAEAFLDQMSRPCVSFQMNTEGTWKWADLTRENIGKAIAIVIDGGVYSCPRVNGEIMGGNAQISGNFTIEETQDLASVLSSGCLPAKVTIVKEEILE